MGRFQGDLPERTYQFARRAVALVKLLPHGTTGWTVGKQLARSGTPVGANVCEPDAALTDREFVMLCNIARREALEVRFWLRLALDEGLIASEYATPALEEIGQIGRILTTIVQKTRATFSKACTPAMSA